ncbi:MAG TPA: TerC/Alx family metal homeostasis membrane protein [Kofleriaceae bacterium]|nr:TerC/Alx family metal homeostasis membrane protein [Kofleriaceae bacterium]
MPDPTTAASQQVPLWAWIAFGAAVLGLLVIDLALHRGDRQQSRAAAIAWTVGWVGAGLLFSLVVLGALGSARAGEYVAAYLIEKALSIDNLFVFMVVFRTLEIPRERQRTVLSWGIFGALAFRLVFILVGIAALEHFHWVVYIFGALLLWGAVRMTRGDATATSGQGAARWLERRLPVTRKLHGDAFFAREHGRRVATPLLVALCAVELTDIVFAFDSVPAAMAISHSRFIVYSSNALAILGLRSLYVLLVGIIGQLRYLHHGLAAVLAFAAFKLFTSGWIEIPALVAIGVVVVCIGASVWPSVVAMRREARAARRGLL